MILQSSCSIQLSHNKERFTLVGRSRAGQATALAISELHWLLDCGAVVQGWQPKIILLTHTHADHIHALPVWNNNNINNPHNKNATIVYAPASHVSRLESFLKAHRDLIQDDNVHDRTTTTTESTGLYIIPQQPHETFQITQGGSTYIIYTLQCDHRIACLGYSIFKVKQKRKQEYAGLLGREIAQLRAEGVRVTEGVEEPFLCFLGDTTHLVFDRHFEILQQHRWIVVECTFLDDDDIERAQQRTHMHWKHLQPIVTAHPHVLFVLIHFSLKYKPRYIMEWFHQHRNVHPMVVWDTYKGEDTEKQRIPCHCFVCQPTELVPPTSTV
jgi:ribonuclease Z